MELWELAARYSFQELEQYRRKDPKVLRQIESVITDPRKGIKYFLGSQLSADFVTRLVCDFTGRLQDDVQWLRHCLKLVVEGHGRPVSMESKLQKKQLRGVSAMLNPLAKKAVRFV